MSKNPFCAPTDDRERRQPPLSPHFGKEYTGITYTADDQNNLRSPGFSRIEAENLAQLFDSHAATLFDEDNASLYLKAHVTPCLDIPDYSHGLESIEAWIERKRDCLAYTFGIRKSSLATSPGEGDSVAWK
jgi:hypothetical protein